MALGIDLPGRDQIGHIAHHEYFAGVGVKNGFRSGPAIATGNNHDFRVLTFLGQFAIALALGQKPVVSKGRIAFDKGCREAVHCTMQIPGFAAGFNLKKTSGYFDI
jgi:hypothetical protein